MDINIIPMTRLLLRDTMCLQRKRRRCLSYSIGAIALAFLILYVRPDLMFMTEVPGWPPGTSLWIADYVSGTGPAAKIMPNIEVNDDLEALIIVHSRPDNLEARDSVRKTWKAAAEETGRIRYYAINGLSVVDVSNVSKMSTSGSSFSPATGCPAPRARFWM